MELQERGGAGNHIDALLTTICKEEFWQRTHRNALEASVYTAASKALKMLLVSRDELLNATTERKKGIMIDILESSGLMAACALSISVFPAVA